MKKQNIHASVVWVSLPLIFSVMFVLLALSSISVCKIKSLIYNIIYREDNQKRSQGTDHYVGYCVSVFTFGEWNLYMFI
jgi:hypothetical protein